MHGVPPARRAARDHEGFPRELSPQHAEGRRTRRHPRPTQFDYLHLRRLLDDLEQVLPLLTAPGGDVLDVFCGSRPYEDLLPPGADVVGLDVSDDFGVADVVSREFLLFPDASFDGVMCLEAFYYVEDPAHGVAELMRVLRPGGRLVVTVPFAWEYDRTLLEHRFTGPELVALFSGWDELRVKEQGGRGVSWSTQTGHLLDIAAQALRRRVGRPVLPLYAGACVALNLLGATIERMERRHPRGTLTLPMNHLVCARRPG